MGDAWRQQNIASTVDVFEGNAFAHELEELSHIKEKYDVLVVCTSSFGEGDPPDNYTEFMLKLLQGSKSEAGKPLTGLQHAVLGEGSSVYRESFQNCPRLTDKWLEECGSRRFVARHETDVGGDEDESVSRTAFREAVVTCLKKGLPAADSAPAAAWDKPRASHTEPTDQTVDKNEASLGGGRGQSMAQLLVPLTALTVAASAYIYTQYFME